MHKQPSLVTQDCGDLKGLLFQVAGRLGELLGRELVSMKMQRRMRDKEEYR